MKTRLWHAALCIAGLMLVGPAKHLSGQSFTQPPDVQQSAAVQPKNSAVVTVGEASVLDKLTDSQLIIGPFEQGAKTVKVIVNMVEPERLMAATNSDTELSIEERQYDVAAAQATVLSMLTTIDFGLRYRFENIAGFSGEVTLEGLAQLMSDPRVESIEPVYAEELFLRQGIPLMNASVSRMTYSGQGVAIAICDTGIDYKHPKLGGAGFPNSKVIGGYDLGDKDSDPMDSHYHGTACAGIAAGDLGDSGDYIGGVAYGAKLYALKVGTNANPGGLVDAVIAALDWCVAHQNDNPAYPILVFSRSGGSGRYTSNCDSSSTAYARAANAAAAAGITIVVASGNDGYCDAISRPACLSNVISVGAVYDAAIGRFPKEDYVGLISSYSCAGYSCIANPFVKCFVDNETGADRVPTYSNTAPCLDILAPGNQAYTLDIRGLGGIYSDDYNPDFGGTSAACPYTAGAVACLQSASKALIGRYLSPSEVNDILIYTGDSVTDTKATPHITKSRINLERAIDHIPITIGTGSSIWSFPMRTYYQDSRTQVVYLASEIGTRGSITGLALDVAKVPGQTMNNWTIRMKHTSLSAYPTCSLDADGWTIVYQSNETVSATGWQRFEFKTPFEYNGVDNLLVDFSYNNSFYTSIGQCRSSQPGGFRSVCAYSDTGANDPLNWSGTGAPNVSCSNNVPNIKLTLRRQTSGAL